MKQLLQKQDYCEIGTITRTNGTQGEVVLHISKQYEIDFETLKYIFVEINSLLIPFFITSFSIKKNNGIIHFTDCNSEDDAQIFLQKAVYAEPAHCNLTESNNNHALSGYTVYSENRFIGTIEDVISYPMHDVLQLKTPDNTEVLIPYNQDYIENLCNTQRSISMLLPDGLLDLYIHKK